jgi:hypothetical protein
MWFEVVLCALPWVAEVVVEESLVLSSWWLKTGIEYKASLGGDD